MDAIIIDEGKRKVTPEKQFHRTCLKPTARNVRRQCDGRFICEIRR